MNKYLGLLFLTAVLGAGSAWGWINPFQIKVCKGATNANGCYTVVCNGTKSEKDSQDCKDYWARKGSQSANSSEGDSVVDGANTKCNFGSGPSAEDAQAACLAKQEENSDRNLANQTEQQSLDPAAGESSLNKIFSRKANCNNIPPEDSGSWDCATLVPTCMTAEKCEAQNKKSAAAGKPPVDDSSDSNKNVSAGLCAQDAVKACKTAATDAAAGPCNPNGSEIKSAKETINNLSAVSQQAAGTGLLEMCQTMNQAVGSATLALTAFKSYCTMATDDCAKVCGDADLALSAVSPGMDCSQALIEVQNAKKLCKKSTQTAADAVNQANALIPAMNRAKQCAQANSSGQMALKTGEVNCSDANTAKSNPVCICRANPRDPVCAELKTSTGPLNTDQEIVTGVESSGPNDNQNLAGPDFQNLDEYKSEGKPGVDSEAGGAKVLAGAGLGSRGGDGSGGGGAGRGGKSSGFLADKLSVLRGFFSGNGGGGGSSTSSGSGNSYGSRGGSSGISAKGNQLDLKQFLPGGKSDPSRSLAGIAGPDGITGPNSNIFLKVNYRYQTYWGIMKP